MTCTPRENVTMPTDESGLGARRGAPSPSADASSSPVDEPEATEGQQEPQEVDSFGGVARKP